MSWADNLVAWVTSNRATVLRYAHVVQAIAGLFLLILAYFIGHAHYHLIREGVRTQGRIVDYREEHFKRSDTDIGSSAFMPIVEFEAGDRLVRFQDWMGSSSTGGLNSPVIVLYDPGDPSVAMIDRPVWNWIPWAPTFGVGVFLVLVAIKGLLGP